MEAHPVRAVSTFYETAPIGRPEQEFYRNGIFAMEWTGGGRVLKFDVLQKVEESLGRERTDDVYVARTIDLDIVLFGNLVSHERDLDIPGPEIRERSFVAIPLCELLPDAVLPDTGERVADLPVCANTEAMQPDVLLTQKLKEMLDES